ncbi:MAG: hypothetical protein O2877_02865, partial [bacterium]|nr:hypothetical protein [bacterium]
GSINIDGTNTHKRPSSGTTSVTMSFDLGQQSVSLYQFFLKIMKLKLKFGDVQVVRNPFYKKSSKVAKREIRYKKLTRSLEAASRRHEGHMKAVIDATAARDKLAAAIIEKDPELALRMGLQESPLTVDMVGDHMLRLRHASAREAIELAERNFASVKEKILAKYPDLAEEFGLAQEVDLAQESGLPEEVDLDQESDVVEEEDLV